MAQRNYQSKVFYKRIALFQLGERSRAMVMMMYELVNNMNFTNHSQYQSEITAKGDGEQKSHQSQTLIPYHENLIVDNHALLQEQTLQK